VLVELVGPRGIGKSTIAPIVARQLDLPFYSGQGWHAVNGRELRAEEVRRDRLLSVVAFPLLFVDAMATFRGDHGKRLRFAFNICRRNRFATKIHNGVTDGGPAHGLCQAAANFDCDLSRLGRHLVRPDVYVRLRANHETVAKRLADREKAPDVSRASLRWTREYERMLDLVLPDRAVITVDANGPHTEVADAVLKGLSAHVATISP
jgi:adenylate kinase family enzyme